MHSPPALDGTGGGYDYTRLWDDFRSLFKAQSLPGEFDHALLAVCPGGKCILAGQGAVSLNPRVRNGRRAVRPERTVGR